MEQATAERIASALERIAASLEASQVEKVKESPFRVQVDQYLNALRMNAGDLTGRLAMREITFACGLDIERRDYRAFGQALKEFGAIKGTSGPMRYYVFKGVNGG